MGVLDVSWYHIRRSPYQAMAAVLSIFVTILLSGIFTLATVASMYMLAYVEQKPQVIVFFKDTATDTEIAALQKTLEDTGKTASIRYVTKNDALATYKELNKNDTLLLEMVTADILPASLEISTKEPSYLRDVESVVTVSPIVEGVDYQKDVVDSLIMWTNAIRVVGAALGVLLAMNAILTIMTVIGMKIALRQSEVEILSLIGASSGYIRAPFIAEGALYGISGAFSAWVVITGLLVWIQPVAMQIFTEIPAASGLFQAVLSPAFLVPSLVFGLGMITLGMLLGIIGSMVAVGRYLRM